MEKKKVLLFLFSLTQYVVLCVWLSACLPVLVQFKNEDDLKNEDNLKNENDHRNEDYPKNEVGLKKKTTLIFRLYSVSLGMT